jgi:hypothetical protein
MQTEERRRNIERAIAEGARAYSHGKRVTIPATVVLAVGRKR